MAEGGPDGTGGAGSSRSRRAVAKTVLSSRSSSVGKMGKKSADGIRRSPRGARGRTRVTSPPGLSPVHEKEKHSITLDKPIVEEIRELFGGQALSSSINRLLQSALVQHRLGLLVDEMEAEAGPASPDVYERVVAQWFEEA